MQYSSTSLLVMWFNSIIYNSSHNFYCAIDYSHDWSRYQGTILFTVWYCFDVIPQCSWIIDWCIILIQNQLSLPPVILLFGSAFQWIFQNRHDN